MGLFNRNKKKQKLDFCKPFFWLGSEGISDSKCLSYVNFMILYDIEWAKGPLNCFEVL